MEKEILTPSEFLARVAIPKEVEIVNIIVPGNVNITAEEFRCSKLTLIDCEINQLIFSNLRIKDSLVFNSCLFSRLVFSHVTIGNFEKNNISNDLSLSQCEISEFLIYDTKIAGEIAVFSTTCKEIGIDKVECYGIILVGLENFGLELKESNIEKDVDFIRCKKVNKLNIKEIVLRSISIQYCSCEGFIHLSKCIIIDNLNFFDSDLKGDVHIDFDNIAGISLQKCNFNKVCRVYNGFSDKSSLKRNLNISQCSFLDQMTVGKQYNMNAKDDIHINSILLELSDQLTGTMNFRGFSVNKFIVQGTMSKVNLFIDNINPELFTFHNFSNYSNLKLINLEAKDSKNSLFNISNSYFGKTQLINIDLDTFKEVMIVNSFLAEIVTSNVNWFAPSKLNKSFLNDYSHVTNNDGLNKEKAFDLSRIKEVYRQLKIAVEKQGNRTDALWFQQLEMKAYEKQLRYSKKKSLQDQIILITNYSNDHGQNWWRPIWLSIVATIFFYCAIIISASDNYFWSLSFNINDIKNSISFLYREAGLFFQLFNPTRNLTALFNGKSGFTLTTTTHFLDLLQRILISYFIFQTISAFRKYTKS